MQLDSRNNNIRQLVLVTGMSGAGRSTALKVFEDMGFESIDNLPLLLIYDLLQIRLGEMPYALAIGIDVRTRHFQVDSFKKMLEDLKSDSAYRVTVIYLDCDDDILRRRYSTSRRRHPVKAPTLDDSIQKEREIMAKIQPLADVVLDTSYLTPSAMAHRLHHLVIKSVLNKPAITVSSFAYGRGIPGNVDIVFDARFLHNPHYEKDLQYSTGLDEAVQEYLKAQPAWAEVFPAIKILLSKSIEGFKDMGRSYVGIACGCTGGQHRSVFVANEIAQWLMRQDERVMTIHRELLDTVSSQSTPRRTL